MTSNRRVEAIGERVSQLLDASAGLPAEPSVRGRLLRCIRDEIAAHGADLGKYLDMLLNDRQALQRLLDRVTVQETAFFPHPEHYDVMARDVLPGIGAEPSIWSAGCANGQESFQLSDAARRARHRRHHHSDRLINGRPSAHPRSPLQHSRADRPVPGPHRTTPDPQRRRMTSQHECPRPRHSPTP
jgi:hypothetical protein